MLNINVTFALMQAITKLQLRFSETSHDWEDEEKIKKEYRQTGVSNEKFNIQSIQTGPSK